MSEGGRTNNSSTSEAFETVMDRRLMMFTMEALNEPIKIKLKNSNKIYSGTLHSFDPYDFSIVVHNFIGADDRAEFKVLTLP